jgi:hypothetical protein
MGNSIAFRTAAGYAGDVNRTHPADVVPGQPDATNPPTLPGQGVIYDATSHLVRKLITGDGTSGVTLIGITVRVYPFQQQITSGNYGAAAMGAVNLQSGVPIDTLRRGFIMATVPTGQAPVPGGAVYIWNTASSGNHIQGGFEATATGGSTTLVSNALWHSGADVNGNAEMAFNI